MTLMQIYLSSFLDLNICMYVMLGQCNYIKPNIYLLNHVKCIQVQYIHIYWYRKAPKTCFKQLCTRKVVAIGCFIRYVFVTIKMTKVANRNISHRYVSIILQICESYNMHTHTSFFRGQSYETF